MNIVTYKSYFWIILRFKTQYVKHFHQQAMLITPINMQNCLFTNAHMSSLGFNNQKLQKSMSGFVKSLIRTLFHRFCIFKTLKESFSMFLGVLANIKTLVSFFIIHMKQIFLVILWPAYHDRKLQSFMRVSHPY